MLNKLKQLLLKRKYNKAIDIYIIGSWAKIGILTEKYYGKLNINKEPLIIHWNDHNGEYESYDIIPWYHATTGKVYCYTFNKHHAELILKILKDKGE